MTGAEEIFWKKKRVFTPEPPSVLKNGVTNCTAFADHVHHDELPAKLTAVAPDGAALPAMPKTRLVPSVAVPAVVATKLKPVVVPAAPKSLAANVNVALVFAALMVTTGAEVIAPPAAV